MWANRDSSVTLAIAEINWLLENINIAGSGYENHFWQGLEGCMGAD